MDCSKEMFDVALTRDRPTYPVQGGTVSQSNQMIRCLIFLPCDFVIVCAYAGENGYCVMCVSFLMCVTGYTNTRISASQCDIGHTHKSY